MSIFQSMVDRGVVIPILSEEPISISDGNESHSFVEVLSKRRSDRELGEFQLQRLEAVLLRSQRLRDSWFANDGHHESSRAVPSAGGRHPHILVLIVRQVTGMRPGNWVLDPELMQLVRVELSSQSVDAAI